MYFLYREQTTWTQSLEPNGDLVIIIEMPFLVNKEMIYEPWKSTIRSGWDIWKFANINL